GEVKNAANAGPAGLDATTGPTGAANGIRMARASSGQAYSARLGLTLLSPRCGCNRCGDRPRGQPAWLLGLPTFDDWYLSGCVRHRSVEKARQKCSPSDTGNLVRS